MRLAVVGDNRTFPRIDITSLRDRSGHAERVHILPYVDEDALRVEYSRARAFAFLSKYEGFGLTPVEALASGVPVLVLDTPVAREVLGDAALYVSRPDPVLIAAALERLLFDDAERTRILTAARNVLERYSWEGCARRLLRTLIDAGRR